MDPNNLTCGQCGGQDFGSFVHHGNYLFKCLICEASGPATSFISVALHLSGHHEAIVVDRDLNPQKIIFKGEFKDGLEKIKSEALKGKLIWLKEVN